MPHDGPSTSIARFSAVDLLVTTVVVIGLALLISVVLGGDPPGNTREPTSWTYVGTRDQTVRIQVSLNDGCSSRPQATAEETDDTVTITATLLRPSEPGTLCTQIFQKQFLDVKLARPLGDRTLEGCRPDPRPGRVRDCAGN